MLVDELAHAPAGQLAHLPADVVGELVEAFLVETDATGEHCGALVVGKAVEGFFGSSGVRVLQRE
ncbi:hypothetical protein A605_03455 [Corynebacterium halotolerans YIM 70093 = DSM 44683]|uniref:Uncharacterized protein n=1 Tax=Corynebacterium halotolerans YIM 70093 = DSM 44683 TaxID=1121362 RepID=M1NQB7_9CORY|nr:hypothetical protein A605_03455 [Corynebacterium halotolerans YIM 70093 = DSM 44683]